MFAFPRGAFVLGTGAPTTAPVTWWSSRWSTLNPLTAGSAPSAFKGFAGVVSLPTSTPPAACRGSWRTGPGNSPPPTTGVPSYMGVLVSSTIRSVGKDQVGDTVRIVVVKTAPGYGPDPSQAGTGEVVATYC